jgi:hypothetical protein
MEQWFVVGSGLDFLNLRPKREIFLSFFLSYLSGIKFQRIAATTEYNTLYCSDILSAPVGMNLMLQEVMAWSMALCTLHTVDMSVFLSAGAGVAQSV